MSTFLELKKNREAQSKQRMAAMAKTVAGRTKGDDETFWTPTVDKEGNGEAVVRYLPAPDGEALAYMQYWDHVFNGPGGWFFEKSLTTLGLKGEPYDTLREVFGSDDPVTEYNSVLWNRDGPGDRLRVQGQPAKGGNKQVPGTKRKLHYVSNVLIVEDSAKPDMVGKVKKYKYGSRLFGILDLASHPKFVSQKAIDPFDMWEGANLRIRIMKKDGYPNYDSSIFDPAAPMVVNADGTPNEEAIEVIWRQCHSLYSIVDRSQFKTYAMLKARLHRVLGLTESVVPTAVTPAPETTPAAVLPAAASDDVPWEKGTEEDGLEEFRNLANV